jgi:hypothetical protein
MEWQKLLIDQWQGCDLPAIEEELSRSIVVAKRIISTRIGPEQCVELDLDSGSITIIDEAFGVEVEANGVLLLAQFISEYAPIVALYVQKVGE